MNQQPSAEAFPAEWEELIQKFLDEDISEDEFSRLKKLLEENAEVRDRYFAATRTVGLLREMAGKGDFQRIEEAETKPTRSLSGWQLAGLGLAAGIILFISLSDAVFGPAVAARLGQTADAVWLSDTPDAGAKFRRGTRLHLASGSANLIFESGASTRLYGPALFDLESSNSGFLHYGQAFSIADTASSEGFTIRTDGGDFVDRGTEFMTTAKLDGYSQLLVTSGAVDVSTTGFKEHRVETGNGVGIESGATPVMIQIERGNETPEFLFPTIPPPSNQDYIDSGQLNDVTLELRSIGDGSNGTPAAPRSAAPEVLFDGKAQANHDDPSESFFFRENTTGYLLFDLGSVQPVSEILTYSWHRNRKEPEKTLRAVQRFNLWGSYEERPANLPGPDHSGGWTRIARVDTDAFFLVEESPDRPPQQACRILSNTQTLGDFRYLLFEMSPTSTYDDILPRHTFFSEIDIFTVPE